MSLGSRLKQARKNKKLTQMQLAELIGAKHNSISNWENDQNRPDPDTISLLCGVLEIDPNWLLADIVSSTPMNNPEIYSHIHGEIEYLSEDAKKELEIFIEYLKAKYKR